MKQGAPSQEGARGGAGPPAPAPAAAAAAAAEAERQRALLAALFAPEAPRATAPAEANAAAPASVQAGAGGDAPGLRAYRANAHATAERALALACPTLHALIGREDFAQLAREFWHAHPPQRGDLAAWGGALPDWLASHAGLAVWPYLADCARLDLALFDCERAADATLDAASLGLLSACEPGALRLVLRPGVRCIVSRWPIATLHAAHAAGADETLFARARAGLESGTGESVIVARAGWRGVVFPVDAAVAAFMQALARDADLSQALAAGAAAASGEAVAAADGPGFDFAAWLADALRHAWLQRAERRA